METDRDSAPTCIAFVRNVVLFLALYRVFMRTVPLSFDKNNITTVPWNDCTRCNLILINPSDRRRHISFRDKFAFYIVHIITSMILLRYKNDETTSNIFIYLLYENLLPLVRGRRASTATKEARRKRKGIDRDTEGGPPKPIPSN